MSSTAQEAPAVASIDETDVFSDPEETRVLYAALDSFRQYRRAAHYNITHVRRQSLYAIPASQAEILTSPPFSLNKTFDAVDRAISSNADIAEAILETGLPCFGVEAGNELWKGQATPSDLDKARSTIRQLYRDWSLEGLPERHAAYTPILDALEKHFVDVEPRARHVRKVLVPGAGLGRLVFEICAAGWTVEGNEISYHQLIASNYVLNYVGRANKHNLYPWALNFSNHKTRAHQVQVVSIPDVEPAAYLEHVSRIQECEVPYGERMSMTSGDFCVLYRQVSYAGSFHAVATCFFIDTAPNVINYIETVYHCLEADGIWINLGPLLWHFESAPTPAEKEKQRDSRSSQQKVEGGNDGIGEPGSFELSHDEVLALLKHYGFEVVQEGDARPTGYIQDPSSMLQNVYRPAFWVARKI